MSIHFYADECGFVYEPDPIPDAAQDVLDSSRSVSGHLSDAIRLLEDLNDSVDRSHDAVMEDPHGYRAANAKTWRVIEAQVAILNDTLTALDKLVRAA
jgi:hypothetical protein